MVPWLSMFALLRKRASTVRPDGEHEGMKNPGQKSGSLGLAALFPDAPCNVGSDLRRSPGDVFLQVPAR